MPDVKWNILLKNPATALKVLLLGSWRSVLILLARIVIPFRVRKLTLRNALARAWISTAHSANSKVFCSEPWRHQCQEVVLAGSSIEGLHQKPAVGGWVIPDTGVEELKKKDAIVLFAHGGGYAIGHGLQNASAFRRWVRKAKSMGQDIAVVTVKYREFSSLPCLFIRDYTAVKFSKLIPTIVYSFIWREEMARPAELLHGHV